MGSAAGRSSRCARGLVALATTLVPVLLHAAPPARFTRLTTEQGLSQNTVPAILQDHLGFLWFGTDEGLDRFDGYAFAVFKHDPQDPGSLPDDVVSALHEDRQHRLWVGTQRGLSIFDRDTETFHRIPAVRERVNTIHEDPDGRLWVGTEGEGVFERSAGGGTFVLHQHDEQDPDSLASYIISDVLRDRRGRLWVATRDAGVDQLDADGKRFIHHRHSPRDPTSLGHDEVWGLAEDAAGDLWVGTYGGGLSVLDHATGAFRRYRRDGSDGLTSDLVTSVFVDRSGVLWVGTDGAGVLRLDAASRRFVPMVNDPGDPTSLSQNVVRCLYEDAQGQLWVGTYMGGANVLRRPRHLFGYSTHNAADPTSLADPSVASFLEDAQGRLWVGTERGWLHRYDRRSGTFTRYRLPSVVPGGSAILALHQDRRGRLWVGTYLSGLAQFDPATGRWVIHRHRAGDDRSLTNDDVWAIAEDEDGSLWLGTNAGVDRFDPEAGAVARHYQTPTTVGIGDTGVRALHVDRHGNLWAGTVGGLDLLLRNEAGFVHYRHDENDPRSISHDVVVALHEDRAGQMWVGTLGGGVGRLDQVTGTFTNYKGLPSKVVYGILEDERGRLWLSTNHGLSRLDPATGSITSFDLTSGLQSLQFHLGASLKTRDGRLLFGSADGLYDFDPESIRPDTFAPPVVFTALRVFNEPVRLPRAIGAAPEITLAQRDKVFSLEFAALDYALPRRNQYAYAMEGFNDQWIPLGGRRDVTFTNLDPGTYRFKVKASNSDGVWSEASSAALTVVIRPNVWRTWWFEGLLIGVLALALVALHRARVRHLVAEIAERKRAEAAVRAVEEKYRAMFENAVEGIYQSTPEGRFLIVNAALARMLGYESPEQMVAEVTDIERQLYVAPGRRRDMLRAAEEQGAARGLELQLRRRDGRIIWVAASLRVVRDPSGRVLYYEGSAAEISRPDHS